VILVIDNYDSFTYNLVQYLGELGEEPRVYRNDKITIDEIERLKHSRIVIPQARAFRQRLESLRKPLAIFTLRFPYWVCASGTKP